MVFIWGLIVIVLLIAIYWIFRKTIPPNSNNSVIGSGLGEEGTFEEHTSKPFIKWGHHHDNNGDGEGHDGIDGDGD